MAPSAQPLRAAPSGADAGHLIGAVSTALQNDVAHDTLLRPVQAGREDDEPRLSDLELDLSDWGFTYGVAWATARAQAPQDSDDAVAQRALAAAGHVFHLYCGDPDWSNRVRLRANANGDHAEYPAMPGANGGSADGNGRNRFPLAPLDR